MTELRTPGLGTRGSGLEEPTDAALDREIERAVSVEPSPEFVARVRTRVASEGSPRRGYGSAWWVLLAGCGAVAAAVLVAAYIGLNPSREAPGTGSAAAVARPAPVQQHVEPRRAPVPSEAPKVASHDSGVRLTDRGVPQPEVRGSAGSSAQVDATVRQMGPDAFPEVMVSASEVAALRQLRALAQAGRGIVIPDETATAADTTNAKEIVIEAIKIEPIELVRLGEAE